VQFVPRRHARCHAQPHTGLGGQPVSLAGVAAARAATAARDGVQPTCARAAPGQRRDVVDGVGRPAAVGAPVAVALQNATPGPARRVAVAPFHHHIAHQTDHLGQRVVAERRVHVGLVDLSHLADQHPDSVRHGHRV
jgi:hypothetical protein